MDRSSLIWAGVILSVLIVLLVVELRRRPFRPSITIGDAPRGRGRTIVGGDFLATRGIRRRQAKPFALGELKPRLRPLTPKPNVKPPENVRPLRSSGTEGARG